MISKRTMTYVLCASAFMFGLTACNDNKAPAATDAAKPTDTAMACFSLYLQDFALAAVCHSLNFFCPMYHGHEVQTILYFEDRHREI